MFSLWRVNPYYNSGGAQSGVTEYRRAREIVDRISLRVPDPTGLVPVVSEVVRCSRQRGFSKPRAWIEQKKEQGSLLALYRLNMFRTHSPRHNLFHHRREAGGVLRIPPPSLCPDHCQRRERQGSRQRKLFLCPFRFFSFPAAIFAPLRGRFTRTATRAVDDWDLLYS